MNALAEVNRERSDAGETQPVQVGIGIHSGPVMIGNVGGKDHVDYRVTGSVVNVASRVEQHTKVVGHPILVTQTTYAKIKAFVSARPAGEAPVRKGDWSVPVLAVIGLNGRETPDWQFGPRSPAVLSSEADERT
jgi:class 3 adenylate cyclase